MAKLKELADKDILNITTTCPYSEETLRQMDEDYNVLSPASFSKKYRYLVFSPSFISENYDSTELQLNYCTNPFCSSFGLEQEKYIHIKGKPSKNTLLFKMLRNFTIEVKAQATQKSINAKNVKN